MTQTQNLPKLNIKVEKIHLNFFSIENFSFSYKMLETSMRLHFLMEKSPTDRQPPSQVYIRQMVSDNISVSCSRCFLALFYS